MRWLNSIQTKDIRPEATCFLDYVNGHHGSGQVPYGKGRHSVNRMDMDYEQHANRLLEDDIISCIEYGRPEELIGLYQTVI